MAPLTPEESAALKERNEFHDRLLTLEVRMTTVDWATKATVAILLGTFIKLLFNGS